MTNVLNFPESIRSKVSVGERQLRPLVDMVPIVQQAVFFLCKTREGNGIKLTAHNNLARRFVQEFWEKLIRGSGEFAFKPYREDDCLELTNVHFLLAEAKMIRISKGYVRLTSVGQAALEEDRPENLYRELFVAFVNRWNWACGDRYPEFEFIQESSVDLVASVMNWPAPSVTPKQLFDSMFECHEEPRSPSPFDVQAYDSPIDCATNCLRTRFFDRFCIPFGLLTNPSADPLNFSVDNPYEKTSFLTGEFPRIIGGPSIIVR